MIKQSFPPILHLEATVLILGSLPGDLSIAHQQYYAHPQNRFWKVLFRLADEKFSIDYKERIDLLYRNNIALWDVCATAIRPGSMDTAILNERPNNIHNALKEYTLLKKICFNGQKAQKLYDKYFQRLPQIDYYTLPSTSPANAQFTLEKLVTAWSVIRGR
jgi:hypoxanthine-DNA glycosylase